MYLTGGCGRRFSFGLPCRVTESRNYLQ